MRFKGLKPSCNYECLSVWKGKFDGEMDVFQKPVGTSSTVKNR